MSSRTPCIFLASLCVFYIQISYFLHICYREGQNDENEALPYRDVRSVSIILRLLFCTKCHKQLYIFRLVRTGFVEHDTG